VAGLPLIGGRFHRMGAGAYKDLMVCQRQSYQLKPSKGRSASS
jgi:hypothetical protein